MLRLAVIIILVASGALGTAACDTDREDRTRRLVRHIATVSDVERAGDADDKKEAMDRLVTVGSYALVEIEQQIHGAALEGQLRLLVALRRIGDPAAVPLLKHLVRWADDRSLRAEAQRTLDALQKR